MEWRLFEEGTVPKWTTAEWYTSREHAPHLEQEGHRDRIFLAARMITDAINGLGVPYPPAVLDLGAGDGGLLSLLRSGYPDAILWGYDLQQSNVDAAAVRGNDVQLLDVVADWRQTEPSPTYGGADVVVATEFLEHLVDPHEMVRRIHGSGTRFLVASSPYTETGDDHYEFHTWAWDLPGYRALLESNGWHVIRQETAWIAQVILAERIS